jgi:myo-inositol-1(or 4)-monophosphatase
MSDLLAMVEEIARQAGSLLAEGYGNVHHIHQKGPIDLVTEFDARAEDLIIASLRRLFPEHAILAEESGLMATESEYQWVIDPLDGTTNFAHGVPVFSVSIALVRDNKPVLGVAYDPLRREMFSAEAGRGATLNRLPIHVSSQNDIGDAVLSTGFPYDVQTNPCNNFAEFARFTSLTRSIRHLGSAALDCAWTAAGRLDGYWEFGVKPWDIAAGMLIVREAGGRVTTVDRQEEILTGDSIVTSNGLLHEQMLQVLGDVRQARLQ